MSYFFNCLAGVFVVLIAVLQFDPTIFEKPCGKWFVIGLAVAAVLCIVASGLSAWSEDKARMRVEKARHLDQIASTVLSERRASEHSKTLLTLADGLYSLKQEVAGNVGVKPAPTIQNRVLALGREILDFLREKGPPPQLEPVESFPSSEAALAEAIKITAPWVDSIHDGYEMEFEERVNDIVKKLRKAGIRDREIDLPPHPHGFSAEVVRQIGENLVMVGAKMLLRGTPAT